VTIRSLLVFVNGGCTFCLRVVPAIAEPVYLQAFDRLAAVLPAIEVLLEMGK